MARNAFNVFRWAKHDLIYADAWRDSSHRPPQPNWPEGHAPKVLVFIAALRRRSECASAKLAWASR